VLLHGWLVDVPTWTNKNETGEWGDPKNWDSNSVPQTGDDIIIPDGEQTILPSHDGPAGIPPNFEANSLTKGLCGLRSGGPIQCETLSWEAGATNVDIVVLGSGLIDTQTIDPNGAPYLLNGAKLTINGALTITGPGDVGGAGDPTPQIVNNGTLTLAGSGALRGNAGLKVTGAGTLVVSGDSTIYGADVDVELTGSIEVDAGAHLYLGGTGTLHLMGGTVTGTGTLVLGDGTFSRFISVEKATKIADGPTIEIAPGGIVIPPPNINASAAPILDLECPVHLTGGNIESYVRIAQSVLCVVDGPSSTMGGVLDLYGTMQILPGGALALAADQYSGVAPRLVNYGRLVLSDTGSLTSGGTIENHSIIEKISNGLASVSPEVLVGGSVVVRAGTLDLVGGGKLTVTNGSVFLAGGNIGSSDASGSVVVGGGTLGGVLKGTGTIAARTINGGWVEPQGGPIAFTASYTQTDTGNLVIPVETLNGGNVVLNVTGGATLAGSLWMTA
jgi:hypothetical protein